MVWLRVAIAIILDGAVVLVVGRVPDAGSIGIARRCSGSRPVRSSAGVGAAGTLLASELVASAQGTILAVACGMFVYIALFDLVPVLWRQRSLQVVTAAVVGATIVMLLGT